MAKFNRVGRHPEVARWRLIMPKYCHALLMTRAISKRQICPFGGSRRGVDNRPRLRTAPADNTAGKQPERGVARNRTAYVICAGLDRPLSATEGSRLI